MLVLSRRKNDRIRIGDDIVIEVAEIHGAKVLIGIEAPQYMRIVREEIADPQAKPSTAAILGHRND